MKKFVLLSALFSVVIAEISYGDVLAVSAGSGSAFSVAGTFNNSTSNPYVAAVAEHAGFSNLAYDNVQSIGHSETVPLSLTAFNPALGTLVRVQVHAYSLGTVTWRYEWSTTDDCIGIGTEGISGGSASGSVIVGVPGYGWSSSGGNGIPDNFGGEVTSLNPYIYAPTVPDVIGHINLIDSDIDHAVGDISKYIGLGNVPDCFVTVSAALNLEVGLVEPVQSSFAVGGIDADVSGYVEVTYTYTAGDGTTQTMTQLASVAPVPEPASLGLVALAVPALLLRRRSNVNV